MEKYITKIKQGHMTIFKNYHLKSDLIQVGWIRDAEEFDHMFSKNMEKFIEMCEGSFKIDKTNWTIEFEKQEDLVMYVLAAPPEY